MFWNKTNDKHNKPLIIKNIKKTLIIKIFISRARNSGLPMAKSRPYFGDGRL